MDFSRPKTTRTSKPIASAIFKNSTTSIRRCPLSNLATKDWCCPNFWASWVWVMPAHLPPITSGLNGTAQLLVCPSTRPPLSVRDASRCWRARSVYGDRNRRSLARGRPRYHVPRRSAQRGRGHRRRHPSACGRRCGAFLRTRAAQGAWGRGDATIRERDRTCASGYGRSRTDVSVREHLAETRVAQGQKAPHRVHFS
jgi:hypothetical protein